jgi:hypothetical protein
MAANMSSSRKKRVVEVGKKPVAKKVVGQAVPLLVPEEGVDSPEEVLLPHVARNQGTFDTVLDAFGFGQRGLAQFVQSEVENITFCYSVKPLQFFTFDIETCLWTEDPSGKIVGKTVRKKYFCQPS